ncbi:MAG: FprA family A-type flavoprotein [Planctomycetota bacterium]|jgi:flavorubredoxin
MLREIKDRIFWVGYIDWPIRDFHSYKTNRGATYNSYLIMDEKNALVDTVKKPFADKLIAHIREKIDPEKISYVICNHAEPDHSGSLPEIMSVCKNAELVCDKKCKEILSMHFDVSNWKFNVVKTGDSISLGKRTMTFVETPMVHWPDSMFTYIPEEKLLFSMDAFGQHYASNERIDTDLEGNMKNVMDEAKKYFANIVMLYGKQISAVLEKSAGLDLEMVAPSHGIIWTRHIGDIVEAYKEWVVCKPKPKVLAIYDSMWGSTADIARAIVEGADMPGVESKLIEIRQSDMTDIATDVLDTACIAFGSATLNMGMMPMVAAVLTYLKGLRPHDKAGFAFGSHGWGKGGAEAINEELNQFHNFEILRDPLKCKFRPTAEFLQECREEGRKLGEKALEMCK